MIAVVALLAFLCANSPALPHAPRGLLPCSCVGEGGGCCHGQGHGEQLVTASSGCVEPDCPACPRPEDDRPDPSCPCPGGCAFCCVAKVPCSPPAVAPAIITLYVDAEVDEAMPVYDPPFSGPPTRPPRS